MNYLFSRLNSNITFEVKSQQNKNHKINEQKPKHRTHWELHYNRERTGRRENHRDRGSADNLLGSQSRWLSFHLYDWFGIWFPATPLLSPAITRQWLPLNASRSQLNRIFIDYKSVFSVKKYHFVYHIFWLIISIKSKQKLRLNIKVYYYY